MKAWSIVLTDLPWLLGQDKIRIEREESNSYERKKDKLFPESLKRINPLALQITVLSQGKDNPSDEGTIYFTALGKTWEGPS